MTYGTWADAEAALLAVNGSITLPGSQHPLAVKFADAKPAELAKFDNRGTKRGAWEMGGMAVGGKRQMMGAKGGVVRTGARVQVRAFLGGGERLRGLAAPCRWRQRHSPPSFQAAAALQYAACTQPLLSPHLLRRVPWAWGPWA